MANIFRWSAVAALYSMFHVAQSTRACNNSPQLCSRAYNNVTYLGAHDSMFVRNATNHYTIGGDQFFTSPVSLDAGVRLLTGQVYQVNGSTGQNEYHLCHTLCQIYDAGTLAGWLSTIASWLDDNPDDVVTILLVNNDNLSAADLAPQFEDAQISKYAYIPADTSQASTSWPTLNELIDMDKRLIVFIASLNPVTSSAAPYLLNEFTFVFENNYDVTNPSDFSCTANRPSSVDGSTSSALSMNLMPLMNHFLYDVELSFDVPAPEHAATINAPSGGTGNLGNAATECTQAYGKPPTYILVDFFNVGPAIDTVDRLNGVEGDIVGRRSLPQQIYSTGSGPTATAPLTSGATDSAVTATTDSVITTTAASSSSSTVSQNAAVVAGGFKSGLSASSGLMASVVIFIPPVVGLYIL